MAIREHHAHMLHLPRWFDIIKYIQLVIAVLIIGLSAFCVAVLAFSAHAYAIFASLYSLAIIIYYLVASKATPKSYNWIALLVLEVVAVIFWLATWAVLGALFAALAYIGSYYNSSYYYRVKRSLEVRDAYSYGYGYVGCSIAAMALAVIQLCVHYETRLLNPELTRDHSLLYVLTLVYMSRAVHRHRKSGQPMRADASSSGSPTYDSYSTTTNGGAADYEKGTSSVQMQPISTPQEHYAQPAPPYPQSQQNKTHMHVEPQMQPSRVQSPISSAHPSEMGMGNHGEMHEAPPQRY